MANTMAALPMGVNAGNYGKRASTKSSKASRDKAIASGIAEGADGIRARQPI